MTDPYRRAEKIHARMVTGFPQHALGPDGPMTDDPRLANPFGANHVPPHRWRISPDVARALVSVSSIDYADVPIDATDRLFGWPLEVDADLPPDSMLLERLRD